MLKSEALSYQYNSGPALKFPDIQCQRGEHWLMLGQSGSGKTTLLNLLAGLRTPDSGIVQVGDTIINKLSASKLDQFRGQHIGIIFQQSHFIRSLTVEDNLKLAQKLAGLPIDATKIKTMLERLNLGHKLKSRTRDLSVGEQQRVAIARALINEPIVILADEPTSALDDVNTAQVIQLLKEQAIAANATLMIVTHDNRLKVQFEKQIQL